MKTIVFYARSLQCKLYGLMGLELEKNYKIIYLVHRDVEETIIRNLNCKGEIYNIQAYIRENWENKSLLENVKLEDFENDYNIPSLWQIFYTDRFLNEFSFEDSQKLMKLHISLFTKMFSNNKPDIFVNEEIAIFSSYVLYFFCAKNNCKYLGLSNPRQIGDKKTAFVNSYKNNFYLLDEMYEANNFTQEQLTEARSFINNFVEKEIVPPYLTKGAFSKKKPNIKQSFRALTKYFYHLYKSPKKDDYTQYYKHKHDLDSAKFYFRFLLQKKHYFVPDYTEKYFYFPLHYQPEASTLVSAPNYEKQQFAMDLFAKKIPIGYMLYVKEHFSVVGHRDMEFYRALKKYPNVRLISPWEDSHKLIKKSEGVITLTGTAGWETVLYGKPVFVLGNVFYRTFKYTNVIDNINDLSFVLKNHKTKNISKEEYDNELTKYVAAYISSSKVGVSYLGDKTLLEPQNIKNLSMAIVDELN